MNTSIIKKFKNLLQSFGSILDPKQLLTKSLLKVYFPVCLFIFCIWLSTKIADISVYELVADPNEIGNIAPYSGMVSTIGVLFFGSIVSICFFTAYLFNKKDKSEQKWRLFFQASGCFVLLLLIDDVFQIHENFSTIIFGTGVDISKTNKTLQNILETIIFGCYGLLFVGYFVYFRKLINLTNCSYLVLSFIFFGLSLIVDMSPETIAGHFILEEGFKLLGIVSLATYYIQVCYQKLKSKS